jgi:hypothetical protein
MTDLSRGARVRRGGRRPGWILLTALLVLAIAASSALVFTNRVELLKLAVILALWAAVVAAFVSVIYRRQSDVDQARARDLKLVYDLQLDREISARREYELTVESQLRRELASELRAHAADEVAALRTELAALRANLEILFNTDLDERPALQAERKALEAERKVARQYNHWDRENASARERVNRVASVRAEEPSRRVDDSSIIDVPEEPLAPPPRRRVAEAYSSSHAHRATEAYEAFPANRAAEAYDVGEDRRGPQWRQGDRGARHQPDQASPVRGWAPSGLSPSPGGRERPPEQRGRGAPDQASPVGGWAPPGIPTASGGDQDQDEPLPPRRSRLQDEAPPQHLDPRSATPVTPPQSQPDRGAPPAAGGRPAGWSAPTEARRTPANNWQQVGSAERRLPAETPGSHWTSDRSNNDGADARSSDNSLSPDSAPFSSPSFGEPTPVAGSGERRGRHSSAAEPAGSQTSEPETGWREAGRRARARHSAEYTDSSAGGSATPGPGTSASPAPTSSPPAQPPDRPPVMSAPAAPAARHRNTDPSSDADSTPSGGQSVADLLARLQTSPPAGGRRRRRED